MLLPCLLVLVLNYGTGTPHPSSGRARNEFQRVESSHETDFYYWTEKQASCNRSRTHDKVDWKSLAEEVQTLAKKDELQLGSRLEVLLIHLLKVRCQPDYPNESIWNATIATQRERIRKLLKDRPDLKKLQKEALFKAWSSIIAPNNEIKAYKLYADSEGNIHARNLPGECLWDFDDVVGDHFYPESVDEC